MFPFHCVVVSEKKKLLLIFPSGHYVKLCPAWWLSWNYDRHKNHIL